MYSFYGDSAENGFYIKPRGEGWQQVYDNVDFSWKPTVKEIFQYYSERTPGAYVETKDTSIVWVSYSHKAYTCITNNEG